MRKKQKHTDYITKLLTSCKSWNGPCTTKDALLAVLQQHPDNTKSIVCAELAFFIHTHPHEQASNPELYRQIKIPIEKKVENLCILLGGSYGTAISSAHVALPFNEDALAIILNQPAPVLFLFLNPMNFV